MDEFRTLFRPLWNFCGKYCYDIASLTCFTAAVFALNLIKLINPPPEIVADENRCMMLWMLSYFLSITIATSPALRGIKHRTLRRAMFYWAVMFVILPLLLPAIFAALKNIPLAFANVMFLTLSVSIRNIPTVVKKFEDDHKADSRPEMTKAPDEQNPEN